MKWLYVINVGKVTRIFPIYCILKDTLICFMKEDICLAACLTDVDFRSP